VGLVEAMKIVGMTRVKNEARWIEPVLRAALKLCDAVVLFDDHSDDGTPEIAAGIDGVTVIASPFEGLNEARDKDYMLAHIAGLKPEFIFCFDGDEELEESGAAKVRVCLEKSPSIDAWQFPILYLWDSPTQARVDGIYGRPFVRSSLFRFRPNMSFRSKGSGPNFHCGNVPQQVLRIAKCDAWLLHYGYLHREDRIRKYHWYNAKDPNNHAEDCYRHMVIGDMPEFPASMATKHGGPLKLTQI
jgi:glycosyltransferase involved in cell wall biosynthesis